MTSVTGSQLQAGSTGRKYTWDAAFIIAFIALSFYFNYNNLIFERPKGIHVWRQTDCASMALNYHREDLPLLRPQLNYRFGSECGGEALGEFPVLYYIVGKLYGIFGYHEYIYRLLWYIIAFIGSFSLYRLALEYTGRGPESAMIGCIPVCSPLMAYYSISFISDPAALYISFISLLAFYLYRKKRKKSQLVLAIATASLAGLLKISCLIVPLSLLASAAFYAMARGMRRETVVALSSLLSILLINYAWYVYAIHFNEARGTNYFLTTITPIWEMSMAEIRELFRILYEDRLRYFYNEDMVGICAVVFLISRFRIPVDRYQLLFAAAVITGTVLFAAMFFSRLLFHDYYMVSILPFIPVLYILSFEGFRAMALKPVFRLLMISVLLILMLKSGNVAAIILEDRFEHPEHNHYNERGYPELESYLDEIGLGKDEVVISIPDVSPNVTLYLMNRFGWTNLYHNPLTTDMIDYFISEGARYLMVGDSAMLKESYLMPYTADLKGRYRDICIFKLPVAGK